MATTASDPLFRVWKEAARARPIADVARECSVTLKGGVEKIGPCPRCSGKDRFSINTRKNVWHCRQCKPDGGDVIEFVQFVLDCDFLAACEQLTGQPAPDGKARDIDRAKLAEMAAKAEAAKAKAKAEEDRRREQERERAHEIWSEGKPPAGTPVEAYLRLRGLPLPRRTSLRFAPAAQLFGELHRGSRPLLHTGPAMLAAITSPEGRFAGVHITWLDLSAPDGKFRTLDPGTGELTPAKKVRGSKKGGRVELVRVADPERVVIGEGHETVLSVWADLVEAGRDLARTAFWSALDLGNLGGPAAGLVAHETLKDAGGRPKRVPSAFPKDGRAIPMPDSVVDVLILGDGDSDPTTTRGAVERASRRWARAGRTIRGAFAPPGTDFNDQRRNR